jgi:hypothetical protein
MVLTVARRFKLSRLPAIETFPCKRISILYQQGSTEVRSFPMQGPRSPLVGRFRRLIFSLTAFRKGDIGMNDCIKKLDRFETSDSLKAPGVWVVVD